MIKDKFNGGIKISIIVHSFKFQNKYLSYNISYQIVLFRLFALTFKSQIREWFDSYTTGSIYTLEYFKELFIGAHHNYDYEKLCEEIKSLQRNEYESIANFNSRIIQSYYRFYDYDRPSKEYFHKKRLSLLHRSVENQMLFDEPNSDHEDEKFESYEFLGESNITRLAKDVVLPDFDSPNNNESIHNVPHPKPVVNSNCSFLSYGVDDATGEFKLSNTSGLYSL